MSGRAMRRHSERITIEDVRRILRSSPLTTKQFCKRAGMSGKGAEYLLRTMPGIHRGKIGRVNLWSLE